MKIECTANVNDSFVFPLDWNKLESSLINSEYAFVRKYFDVCTHDVIVTGIIFDKDEWKNILDIICTNDDGLLLFEGICSLASFPKRTEFLRNLQDVCEMVDSCNLSHDDIDDLFDSGKFIQFVQMYERHGEPYFVENETDFWEQSEDYNENLSDYLDLESYMSDFLDWKRTVQTNSGYWIF